MVLQKLSKAADTTPDELLVGEPVGALAAEPERRVHVLQHVVHLRVVDGTSRTWIILSPDPSVTNSANQV